MFWVGYSDLMTSLFFVMLLLFVVTVASLKTQMKENEDLINTLKAREAELLVRQEELEKVLDLKKQFNRLVQDKSFHYMEECRKFVARDLMGVEIFQPNESLIKEQFVGTTIEVGKKIERFLNRLQAESPSLSYLLVIEGNMANTWDQSFSRDNEWGYTISYQRALAVYNLWSQNNVDFRKSNIEVMISGSGFNGLCRERIEDNNKRFSVQIIPKVSK